jgi:two-component system OmpR family response regulator
MDTLPSILIVDDDREIRILLAEYLDANGFRALAAADGAGMRRILDSSHVDLIVLDLTLSGEDGLTLCRTLRAGSSLPVIMLTARGEPRELTARIRNVLRRTQALPPSLALPLAKRMAFAGWHFDLVARHLLSPQGMVVMLSGAEFRLLQVFLDHPHRVLNRDQLLNLTKGRDADPFDRSIDLQVSRLRQKLGDDAKAPMLLKTVRNEGYVLAATVTTEN